MIPRNPGTYILLLGLPERSEVVIGRGRRLALEPGLYGYVGSALGPGGLAARLRRHATAAVRAHWHIDRLLRRARLLGALIREDTHRHECSWASWVRRVARACVDGFGASDCRCPGHLFHLAGVPEISWFVGRARDGLRAHLVSPEELVRPSH